MSTRQVGSLLLLFLALLGACTEAANPLAPVTTRAPTRLKDTITVAISGEPPSLLRQLSPSQSTNVIYRALSQDLTVRDHQNLYQPRLAEQTPTLENGGARLVKAADGRDQLVVTYRIRKGAKFSNGDPVTSDDVKYSWELYLNPEVPIASRTVATYYERINTPEPGTVEVVYRPGQLDPLYFAFCCEIVSRRAAGAVAPKDLSASAFARNPVYAGPYRLKDWTPGVSITVEAIPDFWLGTPRTKTVVFVFNPDSRAVPSRLRSGEFDVATNDALSLDLIPELDKLGAETDRLPRYVAAQIWEHLDINLRDPRDLSLAHPILGDRRVRQAIAMTVDRDALARQATSGRGTVIASFLFGGSWAKANDAEVVTYKVDPASARRLLDEAGWAAAPDGVRERGGQKLELRLVSTSGDRAREQVVQLIAAQLRPLGFRIVVDLVPSARLFATRGDGPLSASSFDLALYAWVYGEDPLTFMYGCDQVPTKENSFSGQNYTGYCSREFDGAMKAGNERLAKAERRTAYLAAQKIWTGDLPVLPLYQRPNIEVAPKAIRGFTGTPTNTPVTQNVWEWELPER